MLNPLITEHLTSEDDPDLWDLARAQSSPMPLMTLSLPKTEVFAQVGCCRHWIRPAPNAMDCGRRFCLAGGTTRRRPASHFQALPGSELVSVLQMDGTSWEPGRTGDVASCSEWRFPPGRPKTSTGSPFIPLDAHAPEGREKVVQLFGYRKAGAGWSLLRRKSFDLGTDPSPTEPVFKVLFFVRLTLGWLMAVAPHNWLGGYFG